jgi:hypothetical protein
MKNTARRAAPRPSETALAEKVRIYEAALNSLACWSETGYRETNQLSGLDEPSAAGMARAALKEAGAEIPIPAPKIDPAKAVDAIRQIRELLASKRSSMILGSDSFEKLHKIVDSTRTGRQ